MTIPARHRDDTDPDPWATTPDRDTTPLHPRPVRNDDPWQAAAQHNPAALKWRP